MHIGRRRNALAAVILACGLMLPAATEAARRSASVNDGAATSLNIYIAWRDDCSAIPVSVEVVDPPANGKLRVRGQRGTIQSASSGSAGSCAGRSVPGKEIVYTADRGYEGSDTFRVRVSFGSDGPAPIVDRWTVTVR